MKFLFKFNTANNNFTTFRVILIYKKKESNMTTNKTDFLQQTRLILTI